MIEVIIDSIRISLMSQHRVVVLKDATMERYLPIWIGPCEADAITTELQDVPPRRPLTHDLLRNVIQEMGGSIVHVLVNDLRNDVFYARIVVEMGGRRIDIDSRPSDAIALAVRAKTPLFIAESVMDRAAIEPDDDIENLDVSYQDAPSDDEEDGIQEERLSAFKDFLDKLDMDLDTDENDDPS